MMIMQKVTGECQVSYILWDSGVVKKALFLTAFLCFLLLAVLSANLSGLEGVEMSCQLLFPIS